MPHMNHLAHLHLAGPDPGLRLGAFLGDVVKGRNALEALPPTLQRGVTLHRLIDRTADAHPAVAAVLAGMQPPFRRYGGIFLDVLFDRELTRRWDELAGVPLPAFADGVDALLSTNRHRLTPRLRRFAAWARARGLWLRYDDRDMLAEIFAGLARRHGRPSPLARGLEVLDAHEREIDEAFSALYPDLMAKVEAFRKKTDES